MTCPGGFQVRGMAFVRSVLLLDFPVELIELMPSVVDFGRRVVELAAFGLQFLLEAVSLLLDALQLLFELAGFAGVAVLQFRLLALNVLEVGCPLGLEFLGDTAALQFGLRAVGGQLLALLIEFGGLGFQPFAELGNMLDLNLVLFLGQLKGLVVVVQRGFSLVDLTSAGFLGLLQLDQLLLAALGLLAQGGVVFLGSLPGLIPLGVPGFKFALKLDDVLGLPIKSLGPLLKLLVGIGIAGAALIEFLRDSQDLFRQIGLRVFHPLALRRKKFVHLVSLLAQRLGKLICPILIGGCWGGRGFHGRRQFVAELSYTLIARGPGATANTTVQGNENERFAHIYIAVYVYRLREWDGQRPGSSRNDCRDYRAFCNDRAECRLIEKGSISVGEMKPT